MSSDRLVSNAGQYERFATKALADFLTVEAANQRSRLHDNLAAMELPVTVVDAVQLPGTPDQAGQLITGFLEWGAAFGIHQLLMVQPALAKHSLSRMPALGNLPENAPQLFDCHIASIGKNANGLVSGRMVNTKQAQGVSEIERESKRGRRIVILDGTISMDELRFDDSASGIPVSLNLTSPVLRDPFRGAHAELAHNRFMECVTSQSPVNIAGFSMAPHPWSIGGVVTLLPGVKPGSTFHPLSIDIPYGAVVTQAPVLVATVEGQPMGRQVKTHGHRLTVEFRAADVMGLNSLSVYLNGERIRQFDGRGLNTHDASFLLKKPEQSDPFVLWLECRSTDGKRAITDPIWIQ